MKNITIDMTPKKRCDEIEKLYPSLDLKRMDADIKDYDMAVLVFITIEFYNRYTVKKINKPTIDGTKITFMAIKGDEATKAAKEKIREFIKIFNEKYEVKR